jgi:8-oxo-dGTP diphosphatase
LKVPKVQVQAAGGIVLRRESPPRLAVVRLRKRDEWVLPKGKLDPGETPRAAARREVIEETGHNVIMREFLGTLVYESNGRAKVVHYWSMEAGNEQVRELMSDIRAVDWLPLNAAVERLSRTHERAFLEAVGPLAINSHTRRLKAKAIAAKETTAATAVASKEREPVAVPEPAPLAPSAMEPTPELAPLPAPEMDEPSSPPSEIPIVGPLAETEAARMGVEPDFHLSTDPRRAGEVSGAIGGKRRRSIAQKVRRWFRRVA